jgi:hypothetical protein
MADYERCEAAARELMAGWRHWEDNHPSEEDFNEVCEAHGVAEEDLPCVRSALAELAAEAEANLEGV